MPRTEDYFTKNSLFLAVCGLILLAGVAIIYAIDHSAKINIANEYHSTISAELDQRSNELLDSVHRTQNMLDFFISTPPISAIVRSLKNNGVDPVDNTPIDEWYKRIETIFEAYMENNEEIDVARIIRYDNEGKELVRVEYSKENIRITEHHKLQSKSHHTYFKQAKQLKPYQLYVSPINLNREWGVIETPLRPTYRIAKNIYDENNTPVAFLILNVKAKPILQKIQNGLSNHFSLLLVNANGGAVIHPDNNKSFGFEFTQGEVWAETSTTISTGLFSGFNRTTFLGENYYFLTKEIYLLPTNPDSKMTLIIGFNKKPFYADLASRRTATISYILSLMLFVLGTLLLYQRWITKRLAMAEKEAEFEAIIDDSNDAIISMDRNGIIKTWNRSAEVIFGFTARTTKNKQLFELLQTENDSKLSFHNLERVFNGESIPPFDVDTRDQRGHLHTISVTMSPIIISTSDEVTGAAAIIRDITEKKLLDQQLATMNASLERQVEERTAELEIAKNEALKLSEIKSDFIANVSHEIRTPMNGVIGMLNLIEKEPLTEQQRRYLKMAHNSANTLTSLINDILDLSKIESGKLELEERPFDLIQTVGETCASLAISAHSKGLELVCDLADISHAQIIGDENRIRQILINLINNAIKFTAQGYIYVYGRTLLSHHNLLDVNFYIQDTGIGIDNDKTDSLFQSFSQADKSTTREFGGTGLGLAICKKLCQQLGGDITIESIKGKGSKFKFNLVAKPGIENPLFANYQSKLNDYHIFIDTHSKPMARAFKNIFPNAQMSDSTTSSSEKEPLRKKILNSVTKSENVYVFSDDIDLIHFAKNAKVTSAINIRLTLSDSRLSEPFISPPFTPYDVLEKIGFECTPTPLRSTARRSESQWSSNIKIDNHHYRILIVDDNQINIEVGRGVVEDLGYQVETVMDGQSAIQRLSETDFDVVLMDCQMPEMDGYTTTKNIRSSQSPVKNPRVTIIAMTANAMAGSKETCLASGMDDYITKPIDFKTIDEKLNFWTRKIHRKIDHKEPDSARSTRFIPPPEADNSKLWDKDSVLKRLNIDENQLNTIIRLFLDDTPQLISKIDQSLKDHDLNSVAKIAHEIVGTARTIGGMHMSDISSEIEVLAQQGSEQKLFQLSEELKSDFEQLETVLCEYNQDSLH